MVDDPVIGVGGNRHYGRYVGERVSYPGLVSGKRFEGVVVALSATDNNRCQVKFDGDDKPSDCVAEWCRHLGL